MESGEQERGTGPLAERIVDVLEEAGVDTVFGIPGGAIAPLYAAVGRRRSLRLITAKHETNAAFLALGYGLATGKPSVVLTTAGPGITNALTGLATAHYEGVPVVHIAGEVPRTAFGRGALQEGSPSRFDAVGVAARVTKMSALLVQPRSAVATVRKAIGTALSDRRGPVFLSLPIDVAGASVPRERIAGSVRTAFDIDIEAAHDAMRLLHGAERPLIVAGAGTRDRASRTALREIAEHLGAPVCVTTKGKGVFPEDHALYLGVLGFGGHESAVEYLQKGTDVILAVGTGLDDFTTNGWTASLTPSRAFLQIDIDPGQLGKNYAIDLGLVGRADAVLRRLLDLRDRRRRPLATKERIRYQEPEPSRKGMLTTADVVLAMNAVLPPDAIVTADMGEHLAFALHFYRTRATGDFFTCLGFGSMGSGIVSAIGYQLGAPERRTFAICGDGGFLMCGTEMATAVQERIPTTFVIINDSRLNMVHHGLRDLYGESPDFSTQIIDYAAMARSMGGEGYVIRTKEELCERLRVRSTLPVVLDVRADGDVRLGGSQRVAALRQFSEA
jgi:acetolactate synthase I/II/III large subunit